MHKPRQGIVVDGIDLFDAFGLVMTDDYVLSPPEPKTVYVDIPGADGMLDLTEAVGGVVRYGQREMSLTLLKPYPGDEWESLKTDVSSLLHGSRHAFTLNSDPGYTYSGRFSVKSYERGLQWGVIELAVSCDPFKSGGTLVSQADASSGVVMQLTPGRGQAVPQIRVGAPTDNDAGGVQVTLPGAGTWEVDAVTVGAGVTTLRAYSRSGESGNRKLSSWSSQTIGAKAAQMLCQAFWTSTSPTEAHAVSVSYEILEL